MVNVSLLFTGLGCSSVTNSPAHVFKPDMITLNTPGKGYQAQKPEQWMDRPCTGYFSSWGDKISIKKWLKGLLSYSSICYSPSSPGRCGSRDHKWQVEFHPQSGSRGWTGGGVRLWNLNVCSQWFTSSIKVPPPKDSTTSPNCTVSWGPRVQAPESLDIVTRGAFQSLGVEKLIVAFSLTYLRP